VYDFLDFLIRWIDEEPDVDADSYEKIIHPNSVAWLVASIGGYPALVVPAGTFEFSWEPPGLQVVFVPKGGSAPPPADDVRGWVQEMCDNIVCASGLRADVLLS
jgi:hypothetical protein